jgi:hypothetical protein
MHTQALTKHYLQPIRENHLASKCFVKRENTLKGTITGVTPFSPRAIQSRTPFYQAVVGPEIWACANKLKEKWHPMYQYSICGFNITIVYASGFNSFTIGQALVDFLGADDRNALLLILGDDSLLYLRINGVLFAIEIDFRRYDAHMSVSHLQLNHERYEWMGVTPEVLKWLESELLTKGVTHHGLRYCVPGTRRSGDPTTSEGNSHTNGTMILFSTLTAGVFTDINNCPRAMAILQQLGMVPEPVVHHQPELASFCSSYFWPAIVDGRETRVLGPKIGRVISKAFWNMTDIPDTPWLKAVCRGLMADVAHIPILRVLIPKLHDLTAHAIDVVLPSEPHNFHMLRPATISPTVWAMMHGLYGLHRHVIEELEDEIMAQDRLPFLLVGPAIRAIVDHDVQPEPPTDPAPHPFAGPSPMAVGSLFAGAAQLNHFIMHPLHIAILGPIYEECFKHLPGRWGRGFTTALVWFEWTNWFRACSYGGAIVYAPTAAMHFLAARCSLKWGIAIHIAWNCFALWTQRNN